MRGVVLAGGNGTRLNPLTNVTNKHLLPVYDKPMIFWPIQTLLDNGIKDILIVTGKEHMGDIFRLLGSGKEFGCDFTYKVQDEAGGIAEALGLAEDFARGESIAVILGDNIFVETPTIQDKPSLFFKQVDDPERFGCPVFDQNSVLKYIQEKPEIPASEYAVVGLYVYDHLAFDFIKSLNPSERGELEITDVNNLYIKEGIDYSVIHGEWLDAGTIESLHNATFILSSKKQSNV